MSIEVSKLLEEKGAELGLELVAGKAGVGSVITQSELNRPGLALAGYFEHFRHERIQIFGRGEMGYLSSLDSARRAAVLDSYFGFGVPLVVITRKQEMPPEMAAAADRRNIPVLRTEMPTMSFSGELSAYLDELFAPSTTLHGDLVGVYGSGVVILGESGIGKSETTVELLKRGHQFICDDFVIVKRLPGNILMGSCSEISRHTIEVRGIGIVDVKQMFGISSLIDSTKVEVSVELKDYDSVKDIDRTGSILNKKEILNVSIPNVIIPVRPGRNLAILVEVAVMNAKLRASGVNTAEELDRRLIEHMRGRTSK